MPSPHVLLGLADHPANSITCSSVIRGPVPPAHAPFFPIATDAYSYAAALTGAAYELTLGSSTFTAFNSTSSGTLTPTAFKRSPLFDGNPERIPFFPGVCNYFDLQSDTTEVQFETGSCHIGWCGGLPIIPPFIDGLTTLPDGQTYPPFCQSRDILLTATDLQVLAEGHNLPAAYVNGDTIHPLVFIWFQIFANFNSRSTWYSVPQGGDFAVDVLGLGTIGMARYTTGIEAPVTLIPSQAPVELRVSSRVPWVAA